jgi:hypothetical protein
VTSPVAAAAVDGVTVVAEGDVVRRCACVASSSARCTNAR